MDPLAHVPDATVWLQKGPLAVAALFLVLFVWELVQHRKDEKASREEAIAMRLVASKLLDYLDRELVRKQRPRRRKTDEEPTDVEEA